jgi:hypothetical protein
VLRASSAASRQVDAMPSIPKGSPPTTPIVVSVPSWLTEYAWTNPLPVCAYRKLVPAGEVMSIGPGCVVATTPDGVTSDGCPAAEMR